MFSSVLPSALSQSYLNGLLLGASLIIAIGAQNAFVLAQSLKRNHHLWVAALCAGCDTILVGAGVFGLAGALASSPLLLNIARWGGALFLAFYALQALRRALHPQVLLRDEGALRDSRRKVLLATLAVTLLNPHVYLDTVLLVGSLGSQQASPAAYAVGASSASLLWFFGLALGGARLAPWLARPGTWRLIDLAVALGMASISVQLMFAH